MCWSNVLMLDGKEQRSRRKLIMIIIIPQSYPCTWFLFPYNYYKQGQVRRLYSGHTSNPTFYSTRSWRDKQMIINPCYSSEVPLRPSCCSSLWSLLGDTSVFSEQGSPSCVCLFLLLFFFVELSFYKKKKKKNKCQFVLTILFLGKHVYSTSQ